MSSVSQELTTNLSALLFGNIANAVLFGLTTVQTYAYWTQRGNDPVYLLLLLSLCWFIDILQLALFSLTTYTYTIAHFGDAFVSTRITWTLPVLIFLTGASDLIIRSIFCFRIWKLSGHNALLTGCLALSSVVTTAIDWVFAGMSFTVSSFDVWRTHPRFSALIYAGLSNAVVGDILIAASLSLILRNHLKDLPSIETGALTSVCTLACLIMFATLSQNYAYIAMYLLLSKFSLNALLATLNARRGLREVSIAPMQQPTIPMFLGTATANDSADGTQFSSTLGGASIIEVNRPKIEDPENIPGS
ncbi:hypothetical protein FOMPIDRAFT_1045530 [Fomitopsis schrenkii]|uniref:DUF6534 domain-containing protein n=1 Tax=Fomitopsis schrenkii TaxID=2126942 RepID=S8G3J2_FOMSC|nr:hypothetical protein FOMPIDRAFT_1045530 [Fomitopsis schrenkii]